MTLSSTCRFVLRKTIRSRMDLQGDHVYITPSGTLTVPIIHTETIQANILSLTTTHFMAWRILPPDISSRGDSFMHKLTLKLILKQSCKEYRVARKLASRVIFCLRGKPLPMASLHKLPELGEIIEKLYTELHTFPRLTIN